jgi:hypothetical protein
MASWHDLYKWLKLRAKGMIVEERASLWLVQEAVKMNNEICGLKAGRITH